MAKRRARTNRPSVSQRTLSTLGLSASPSANSIHASRPASGRSRRSPSRSIRYRHARQECGPRAKDPHGAPISSSTTTAMPTTSLPSSARQPNAFGVDAPENLRAWLAKEFFALHIKKYSKSRRKAPIYWQLATTSASYSVWLYIHAFTKDTLFRVQNDYAAPKLAHEERRLMTLAEDELRGNGTAAQRRELATQEAFVEELRAFVEEVKRVASLWNPNLDDGVVINFAPLWRLVPQHKAWQKELKATWDSLCSGDYDWAHLAMRLWPERVVPKCASDRSLAIAHGLEDAFWEQDDRRYLEGARNADLVD